MADGEVLAELVLDGDQEFQQGMENAGQSAQQLGEDAEEGSQGMDEMEESFISLDNKAALLAGGGMVAAGGAMEGMMQNTKDVRGTLNQTAITMGSTESEVRNLATSVSDANFPLQDASQTMQILSQRGVENQDEMQSLAGDYNTLANAVGVETTEATRVASQAMQAFGDDAGDVSENMDTLTYMAKNTSLDFDEIGDVVSDVQPVIKDLGLDMDEVAAYMSSLEENGVGAAKAQELFASAAEGAEGDQSKLNEELGISQQQLQKHQQNIKNAEGSTKEYAAASEGTATTMDQLRSGFQDVQLAASGILGPVEAAAPALMTLGTTLSALATVNVSAVVPSLTATYGALVPLLPVLLPLIAAAGALAVAWKTDFLGIQGVTKNVVNSAIGWLRGLEERVQRFAKAPQQYLQPFVNYLRGPALETIRSWAQTGNQLLDVFVQKWGTFSTRVQAFLAPYINYLRGPGLQTLRSWAQTGQQLLTTFQAKWSQFSTSARETLTPFVNYLRGPGLQTIRGWITTGQQLLTTFQAKWSQFSTKVQTFLAPYLNTLRGEGLETLRAWAQTGQQLLTTFQAKWSQFSAKVQTQLLPYLNTLRGEGLETLRVWVNTGRQLLNTLQAKWAQFSQAFNTHISPYLNVLRGEAMETLRAWVSTGQVLLGILSTKWGQFSTQVQAQLQRLTPYITAAQEVFGRFAGKVQTLLITAGGHIQRFGARAQQVVSALTSWLVSTGISQIVNFGNLIISTVQKIHTLWNQDWMGIRTVAQNNLAVIQTIVKGAADSIYTAIRVVLALLRADWGEAWTMIKGLTSRNLNRIKQIVSLAKQNLVTIFTNLKNAAVGLIQTLYNEATSWASNLRTQMWLTIIGMKSDVVEAINGLVDDSVQAVEDSVSTFVSAGEGLVDAIVDGIKSSPGAVKDAVGDVVGDARDMLPFSPAKEGPLSDLDRSGQSFVTTWADNVEDKEGKAVDAVETVTSSAAEAATKDPSPEMQPSAQAAGSGTGSGSGSGQAVEVDARMEEGAIQFNGITWADAIEQVREIVDDRLTMIERKIKRKYLRA